MYSLLSRYLLIAVIVLAGCKGTEEVSQTSGQQTTEKEQLNKEEKEKQSYLKNLPPLIDRDKFFGDPKISSAELSPDGRYITFRKPNKGVMNIWIKKRNEPFDEARPITADTTRPVSGYFWSANSEYVLYTQDKGGNENYHIYAVDPDAEPREDTGVPPARDLTDMEDIRAQIYSVPEATPNEIIIGLNDRNKQLHDVYRLNIETGEKELLIKNDKNVASWIADRSGKVRLAMRQTQTGGTELLKVQEDTLLPVYEVSSEESVNPLRFHKNNEQLYMSTNKGDSVDLSRLVLFNPDTREVEYVESDPEQMVDFGGALFANESEELIATYYVGDRLRIYPKDERFKQDMKRFRKQLPDGEIYPGSHTEDDQYWIVRVARDVDPGTTYLYNRESGEIEKLYESRPELPSEDLAHMEAIRYTARDGTEIPAYLTLPKGVEHKNLPTIIFPHGGPWARDTWGYSSFPQFLANRGYAVLQPNFRGSTGYGKDFLNAGNKEWGTGVMQHDITDGVNYLIEQGIADPDRVGIMGGSYGGYATLAGVAFTPDLYAAGVSIVGPSNIITLLNSIPPYWAPIKKLFEVRVGDLDDPEERKRMKEQSPLFSADQIKAPLLVIQGANDPRVKKAESDQIVEALHNRDRQVKYLVAEDEGHGFQKRGNRLAFTAYVEEFLAQHLGGRYQQEMSDEIRRELEQMKVDVSTVEAPDKSAKAGSKSSALPQRDLSKAKEHKMVYHTKVETQGRTIERDRIRKVARKQYNGQQAWMVQDSTGSGQSMAKDVYYLHSETLEPLQRDVNQGMMNIEISYSDTAVTGSMKRGQQSMNINTEVTDPLLGNDSALEFTMTTFPLKKGYATNVRVFDLMQQKIRMFDYKVSGMESVKVPAGTFECYKVEMTPQDDGGGEATYWVRRQAPHYVIRIEAKLPPMAGSGSVTSELKSME